jgi:hypothetical protein
MTTKTIQPDVAEALQRLIAIAQRDTGQSRRVANFLLAWWNAEECKGFDLTDLWPVDAPIRVDMLTVVQFIANNQGIYPDAIGYAKHFQGLVEQWRPRLDPVQRTILEIRNDGKDISVMNVLSTSEQCAVALAIGTFDRLPKPYEDRTAAWDRLDPHQRSIVATYNPTFSTDEWQSRPCKY